MDFQHSRGRRGQRLQAFHRCRPVDVPVSRPQMLVAHRVVVMHMHGDDPAAERGDGFGNADRDVRVSQIETSAQPREMSN